MKLQLKEQYLQAFVKIWNDFNMFAKLLEQIFEYLNRSFLPKFGCRLLGETSLLHFLEQFYEKIKVELREVILDQISRIRNSEIID